MVNQSVNDFYTRIMLKNDALLKCEAFTLDI